MNPPTPAARLRHIPVRLRVTVDPKVWGLSGRELTDAVREFCAARIRDSGALVVDVRRDQL